MDIEQKKFIQQNSPDGGFLQSDDWRKFQASVGRKTYNIISPQTVSSKGERGINFWANIIEHQLPLVGKYFYVPRGPVIKISNFQFPNSNDQISKQLQSLINLAKKERAGWIRIEPATEEVLNGIRKNVKYKIIPSPHDMQPKEIFMIDISKSEEELLAGMKAKTRYNIKLAEKKGVKTWIMDPGIGSQKYIDEFLRLTKVMGERNKIATHPESYYRKMLEVIPSDILKLYLAEYDGKIICANLVIFYGGVCTYFHGASDDAYRNVMAPYLLQWKQIQDAKKAGCLKYDFGGINTRTGAGITRFKAGFSPTAAAVKFPGCYDIILDKRKYLIYRSVQKLKSFVR